MAENKPTPVDEFTQFQDAPPEPVPVDEFAQFQDAPSPGMPGEDFSQFEDAPPEVPQAFIDRIRAGHRQTATLAAAIKGAGQGAYDALTSGPLGIDNFAPETKKFMINHGFILDRAEPLPEGFMGTIRLANDQVNRTFFQGLDALNRLGAVPGAALGGGMAEVLKVLGEDPTRADRRGAEVEEFANLALLFAGTPEAAHIRITRIGPRGEVLDLPVSIAKIPDAESFHNSALAITDGADMPHVRAKLERLYQERGVLPAEAAWDAARDPEVRQSLVSTGSDLPQFYGGDRAGFGGQTPPSPPPPGGTPLNGRTPPPAGSYEAAREAILGNLSIGENPKLGPSSRVDDIYRGFLDKFYPIDRALKAGQIELSTADNPYRLARLFSGVGGKIDVMLNRYMFDFHHHEKVGPALKEILAPIKDKMDDFRAFLISARALELDRRGITTGFDLDAARTVGKARTQVFEDTAVKLYEFQRQVAQYARDAGLLSRKGYDEMIAANRMYVPFHALMDVENRGIPGIRQSNMQPGQPFRKISGSERVKIDPLESIIKNTFTIIANADKNNVGVKLIDALLAMQPEKMKRAPGNDLIIVKSEPRDLDVAVNESIREAQGKGLGSASGVAEPSQLVDIVKHSWIDQAPGEISIFRDGKRTTYQVDPELAEAFKNMDAPTLGDFNRYVMAPFAKTLRAGAVLAPDFWLRHVLRDYAYAFATYKGQGQFHPVDMARGVAAMIMGNLKSKGELGTRFVDWMRDGGGEVAMVALDRDYLQMNLEKLTADTGLMTRAWNVVKHPLHPLQVANEVATSASHLGAYIKHMRALERDRAKAVPPGPEAGSAAVVAGPRQPGALLGVDKAENLPAHLKGDLVLRSDVNFSEGMKAFHQHIVDGEWKDVSTKDQALKRDRLEAAWIGRDTSVDVARMGAKTSAWNQISAFFNAKLQDTDSWMRAIKNNPASALKLGAAITLPSVLLWFYNRDNQRVQDLPNWQKDIFWIIPVDRWENTTADMAEQMVKSGQIKPDEVRISNGQLQYNNQILFRYPKPFAAGVIFGTLPERLLDMFAAEKPHAMKGFLGALTESTAGNLLPTAVVPVMEQWANRSMMTGRNIVPAPMEGILPEYQYTPYTSELAKRLARLFGEVPTARELSLSQEGGFTAGGLAGAARAFSSPILIENYWRGWTGNLGVYAFKLMDTFLTKAGALPEQTHSEGTLADVPIIKAFIARHPGSSQAVQDFYDHYAETKPYRDTLNYLRKQGDIDSIERIRAMGGEQVFLNLDGIRESLGNQSKMIRQIDAAPETMIPKDEKRQLIDMLFFRMMLTARQGSEFARRIRQGNVSVK